MLNYLHMRTTLLVLVALLVLLFIYWGVVFYNKVQVGVALAGKAVAYNNLSQDHTKALLVLGDSVAVGVGATRPEESLAGLLAHGMGATYTENNAVSGAQVSDLPGQMAKIKLAHYNTILIQIGGNDIIRFHNVEAVSAQLATILDSLTKRADRVLLMSAGDVGTTTIFPSILKPFYTRLTLAYHAAFTKVATDHHVTYINLYTPPEKDPFIKSPTTYFAADGLHLTSAGYALWYKRLEETVIP
jgi:lysophospholipase L1-like esterase